MSIRGVTFSKQIVSSNDDSHVYKVLLGGRKGRTKGCNISYENDDIFISAGYFFAANRLVEITSIETIATPVVSSGTTYCRLVFEIDLTKTNTNDSFAQGYFKILTSSTGYPAITQEDLEEGGNVYQLPFARFTKTISGIGAFVAELETIDYEAGSEVVTDIYVSKNGNNNSGDGSEASPYATIQYAIDSIPKNLCNRNMIIHIASGTYAEDVLVSGFYGGTLRLEFATVTINMLSCYESNIILAGTALTIAASGKTFGLYAHKGANVICQVALTVNGSTNGITITYGSRFTGTLPINVNSCTYAVTVHYASQAYFATLGGSKNNNAVQAASGIAHVGTFDSSMASTAYVTSYGGRIFIGSQASVPNY